MILPHVLGFKYILINVVVCNLYGDETDYTYNVVYRRPDNGEQIHFNGCKPRETGQFPEVVNAIRLLSETEAQIGRSERIEFENFRLPNNQGSLDDLIGPL